MNGLIIGLSGLTNHLMNEHTKETHIFDAVEAA
jgi:hypothetical protein